MTTPLQQAAQAMIDRWESPDWKDTPHTAHYIEGLRKALDAELAQVVEPVAWVSKHDVLYSFDDKCAVDPVNELSPLYLHPPQPQATTPVPEGFALVPVEPTDEELAKGVRAMSLFVTKNSLIDFSLGYKAMLAAQGEKP